MIAGVALIIIGCAIWSFAAEHPDNERVKRQLWGISKALILVARAGVLFTFAGAVCLFFVKWYWGLAGIIVAPSLVFPITRIIWRLLKTRNVKWIERTHDKLRKRLSEIFPHFFDQ